MFNLLMLIHLPYLLSILCLIVVILLAILNNNMLIGGDIIQTISFLGYEVDLSLDQYNLPLILLTGLLTPLMVMVGSSTGIVTIELLLLALFILSDMASFYLFFELILIPLFIVIALDGPRRRRLFGSSRLFIYTILGSLLLITSILYAMLNYGSTNNNLLEL